MHRTLFIMCHFIFNSFKLRKKSPGNTVWRMIRQKRTLKVSYTSCTSRFAIIPFLIAIVPDSVGGYSLFVSFVCLFVCLCVCWCVSVCLSHLFLSHAFTQKLLLSSVTQVWPTTEAY